jgi:hypothetical protein
MRDIELLRDAAGIVDILAGAAGALAMRRLAVIVELQRHADDVVALAFQQSRHHRGIDPAGHRDNDARVFGAAGKFETVEHGWSA